MLLYAIPLVKTDSAEPVLSAGKIAQAPLETTELTVLSLALMAEEPATPQERKNVKVRIHKDVKRTVFYGILSVKTDSMPLAAVYAHLIVLVV